MDGEFTVIQLWIALALLDVVVEQVGLDGWDYRPEPANTGLRKTAVRSGLLDADTAAVLSKDEVLAAMQHGWGAKGADPVKALRAALERARGSIDPTAVSRIIAGRQQQRCGTAMPRASVRCIRRKDHPGPHRAKLGQNTTNSNDCKAGGAASLESAFAVASSVRLTII